MKPLLQLFWSICLLRKGPEDVPASPVLLKLCLLSYGLIGLLGLLLMANAEASAAMLQMAIDIVLLVALVFGILNIRGYRARFVQTLTALAGTGTLLGLIFLPLAPGMRHGIGPLLLLGLMVWNIAIITHILQHALSTSHGIALAYTLSYVAISLAVMGWLLPQTG